MGVFRGVVVLAAVALAAGQGSGPRNSTPAGAPQVVWYGGDTGVGFPFAWRCDSDAAADGSIPSRWPERQQLVWVRALLHANATHALAVAVRGNPEGWGIDVYTSHNAGQGWACPLARRSRDLQLLAPGTTAFALLSPDDGGGGGGVAAACFAGGRQPRDNTTGSALTGATDRVLCTFDWGRTWAANASQLPFRATGLATVLLPVSGGGGNGTALPSPRMQPLLLGGWRSDGSVDALLPRLGRGADGVEFVRVPVTGAAAPQLLRAAPLVAHLPVTRRLLVVAGQVRVGAVSEADNVASPEPRDIVHPVTGVREGAAVEAVNSVLLDAADLLDWLDGGGLGSPAPAPPALVAAPAPVGLSNPGNRPRFDRSFALGAAPPARSGGSGGEADTVVLVAGSSGYLATLPAPGGPPAAPPRFLAAMNRVFFSNITSLTPAVAASEFAVVARVGGFWGGRFARSQSWILEGMESSGRVYRATLEDCGEEVAACGNGSYTEKCMWSPNDGTCAACTVCGEGTYVGSQCTRFSDAVCTACEVCPAGQRNLDCGLLRCAPDSAWVVDRRDFAAWVGALGALAAAVSAAGAAAASRTLPRAGSGAGSPPPRPRLIAGLQPAAALRAGTAGLVAIAALGPSVVCIARALGLETPAGVTARWHVPIGHTLSAVAALVSVVNALLAFALLDARSGGWLFGALRPQAAAPASQPPAVAAPWAWLVAPIVALHPRALWEASTAAAAASTAATAAAAAASPSKWGAGRAVARAQPAPHAPSLLRRAMVASLVLKDAPLLAVLIAWAAFSLDARADSLERAAGMRKPLGPGDVGVLAGTTAVLAVACLLQVALILDTALCVLESFAAASRARVFGGAAGGAPGVAGSRNPLADALGDEADAAPGEFEAQPPHKQSTAAGLRNVPAGGDGGSQPVPLPPLDRRLRVQWQAGGAMETAVPLAHLPQELRQQQHHLHLNLQQREAHHHATAPTQEVAFNQGNPASPSNGMVGDSSSSSSSRSAHASPRGPAAARPGAPPVRRGATPPTLSDSLGLAAADADCVAPLRQVATQPSRPPTPPQPPADLDARLAEMRALARTPEGAQLAGRRDVFTEFPLLLTGALWAVQQVPLPDDWVALLRELALDDAGAPPLSDGTFDGAAGTSGLSVGTDGGSSAGGDSIIMAPLALADGGR